MIETSLSPLVIDLKTRMAMLPVPLIPLPISGLENPIVQTSEELLIFFKKGTFSPTWLRNVPLTISFNLNTPRIEAYTKRHVVDLFLNSYIRTDAKFPQDQPRKV